MIYMYKLPTKRGHLQIINKERFRRIKLIKYNGFNIEKSNDKCIIFTLSPKFIRTVKLMKINHNLNELEKDLIYLVDNSKQIEKISDFMQSYEYETYNDKLDKQEHFKSFQIYQNNLYKNKYKI